LKSNEAGRVYVQKLEEAVKTIRNKVQKIPKHLIVLGSGLGGLVDALDVEALLPYKDIPNFPFTATDGHAGNLVVGSLNGVRIAAFQGRVHCHDGYNTQEVAFGVRVMAMAGVENVVVTNASGGLSDKHKVGDLMLITNHLSFFLNRDPSQDLIHEELGEKFYPHTHPFSEELIEKFSKLGNENNITVHKGIYCYLPGPRYESAYEVKFLKQMGVDAIGMSTVPEVLAICQRNTAKSQKKKIKVIGIATITNVAAGLSDAEPNHEEVKTEGVNAGKKLQLLIEKLLEKL